MVITVIMYARLVIMYSIILITVVKIKIKNGDYNFLKKLKNQTDREQPRYFLSQSQGQMVVSHHHYHHSHHHRIHHQHE